jgi:hypothetical protein
LLLRQRLPPIAVITGGIHDLIHTHTLERTIVEGLYNYETGSQSALGAGNPGRIMTNNKTMERTWRNVPERL